MSSKNFNNYNVAVWGVTPHSAKKTRKHYRSGCETKPLLGAGLILCRQRIFRVCLLPGEDGEDREDGKDGEDGEDGKDGDRKLH